MGFTSKLQGRYISIWCTFLQFKVNLYLFIFIQDGADGHNFERGPPKDHFSKVLLRLAQ